MSADWDKTKENFTGLGPDDIIGYLGEWAVEWVLQKLGRLHWSHFQTGNDPLIWKTWNGKNPDQLIYFKPKDVYVEVKNNSGKYDINSGMAKKEIVARF